MGCGSPRADVHTDVFEYGPPTRPLLPSGNSHTYRINKDLWTEIDVRRTKGQIRRRTENYDNVEAKSLTEKTLRQGPDVKGREGGRERIRRWRTTVWVERRVD